MNASEIRLRCLEAAAKAPIVHKDGPEAGVLAMATRWSTWALYGPSAPADAEAYWQDIAAERPAARGTLRMPGK